ncbi:hypothetical protein BH09ACT8_BH09ACT8_27570 [soil metagenome]
MAALGLSACAAEAPDSASSSVAPPPAAGAPQPTGLPAASELIDVLTRLADPAVSGADKLPLVEGATGPDAADLEKFAKALQDNRMLPLTFAATDLVWSPDTAGEVTANVTATPADPGVAPFSFPMDFTSTSGKWQLSRQTADLILTLGGQSTTASTTTTQNPMPTPTPTR